MRNRPRRPSELPVQLRVGLQRFMNVPFNHTGGPGFRFRQDSQEFVASQAEDVVRRPYGLPQYLDHLPQGMICHQVSFFAI